MITPQQARAFTVRPGGAMKVDPTTGTISDLSDDEAASLRDLCERMLRGAVSLDHPLFAAWADVMNPECRPAAMLSIAFLPQALHALLVQAETAPDDSCPCQNRTRGASIRT